ncbi:MAG: hypothetical protein E5Y88_17825 [Mesorhizobium sp.]|uniref:hypothetical protein n=1 Tax=Mesorhizobium sp. TaxID=1871066 RepID=UPI000FE7A372|nr:hypothetical protein [Mesorhizobium sp.]RWQ38065.1 MAG: hypothetical protein EOS20_09370 [Mesorhizobium sp.]TIL24548.1 MAG: hypothetical protein E5Y88_17825 [Mesorhizobium sp.]
MAVIGPDSALTARLLHEMGSDGKRLTQGRVTPAKSTTLCLSFKWTLTVLAWKSEDVGIHQEFRG